MRRRTQRRATERAASKLADQREKLAALEPGGTPARPLDVEASSQVEVHARSMPCPRCDGERRIDEHTAETIEGVRLRVAHTTCLSCGTRREIYFRIAPPAPN